MRILVAALLLCQSGLSFGQSSTFEPLKIGVNAESGAMGDAHVATVHDAFAPFSNPAGLAGTRKNTVAVAHHIWVGTSRSYAVATQFAVGSSLSAGAFVLASGLGSSNPDSGGDFVGGDVQSVVAGVAVANRFGPVRVGASAKYLSEKVIRTPSRGVAVDVGIQASVLDESIRIGASVLNVGKLSDVPGILTEIPTMFRLGLALYPFRVISFDDAGDLLNAHIAVQVSRVLPDEETRVHVGAAIQVLEMLTARAGYVTNDDLRGFTAGLGLNATPFQFDYALVPFSQGFGGPGHQLSLVYGW